MQQSTCDLIQLKKEEEYHSPSLSYKNLHFCHSQLNQVLKHEKMVYFAFVVYLY
jgi:hypothetical protein